MKTMVIALAALVTPTAVELNPYSSVIIGIVVGFAGACALFLLLFNKRLKEWKQFYDTHDKEERRHALD